MDRQRFEELRDSYALGALPPEERREFEEYLASNPERQAEVDELGAVAGLLALYPEEQDPPPELRQNIMSIVEAEARDPEPESRSWLAGLREMLDLRNVALGAATLLVVGLFSWNLLLQDEVSNLQGEVANLEEASRENQTVALEGTGAAQQAEVELVFLEDSRAVLVGEDVPEVPEGSTYQIWVIEGDVPQPSGLFQPGGEAVAAVVENPPREGEVIAVSVEPEGGSPQPTTDPILTGKL